MILLLLALGLTPIVTEAPPSYQGKLQIPVDLCTADGVRLEKGLYQLEVKQQGRIRVLIFSAAGTVKAVVKEVTRENSGVEAAGIPLVGTHYLRSSDEPVLTAQERRMSKTGSPRYEEEARDWKAAVRVFRSRTGDPVFFTFHKRLERGQWSRSHFRLFLSTHSGELSEGDSFETE